MLRKKDYPPQYLAQNKPIKQVQRQIDKKKLKIKHFTYDIHKYEHGSSSSMGASSFKNNSINEHEKDFTKADDIESLDLVFFCEKYLPRNSPSENLEREMHAIIERKQEEINSLLVYRDELKLIGSSKNNSKSIKLSLSTLKQKSLLQSQMKQKGFMMQKKIREFQTQLDHLCEFMDLIKDRVFEKNMMIEGDILDINKQEELIIKNLQMETTHLIKELGEEQRKNQRGIIMIKEEIQDLRIMIKQKEDRIRDLKAKICTMYIKLHNRNHASLKNKDRNMSISIKKFNNINHLSIREVFVGSNSFKTFSKQVIEKVNSQQELIKIRFFISNTGEPRNYRQRFTFQCLYKNHEGIIHDHNVHDASDNQITRDKISEQNQRFEEIDVKYLLSMKFFFKSKIVGVECRLKTEKGNRHLQIGNCTPNIEHELLTLVNKNLVTIGSFWHSREMIGISLWYSDKLRNSSLNKSSSQKLIAQSFDSQRKKGQKKSERPQGVYDQYYA